MKVIAKNKQAKRNYEILDTYQAGISLLGNEIKSIRRGNVSMDNSYVSVKGNIALLKGVNISALKESNDKIDTLRDRQLLLHKSELRKLRKASEEKGNSIVALAMGINNKGYAKVDIAVARGLKKADKREKEKQKDFNKLKKAYLG
jgi:SsrA-binding protein